MSKLKPYYKQIADELERDIVGGKFSAGSRLPTEREIQERFYVSRMTVRQAYKLLEKKGTAVIVKNKGIFVKDTSIEKEQHTLNTKDLFNQAGIKLETKVSSFTTMVASEKVRAKLNLAADDQVYRLERYRYGKDELIFIEVAYLPVDRFPDLQQYDFAINSLYEVLGANYNLRITKVSDDIKADQLSGELALMMLKAKRGPVLKIKTLARDYNNEPVEYTETLCNYKVFTYKASYEVK